MEGHIAKQKDFLPDYYYLDKTRAVLDEELFYKPIEKNYPYKLLIDFNALEVTTFLILLNKTNHDNFYY